MSFQRQSSSSWHFQSFIKIYLVRLNIKVIQITIDDFVYRFLDQIIYVEGE